MERGTFATDLNVNFRLMVKFQTMDSANPIVVAMNSSVCCSMMKWKDPMFSGMQSVRMLKDTICTMPALMVQHAYFIACQSVLRFFFFSSDSLSLSICAKATLGSK